MAPGAHLLLPLAVVGSGVVSASFVWFLWPHRRSPGARFFIATIACEALWAVAYGLALFVFEPSLRRAFEAPIWLGINFIGVCFLAFALEYTGRGALVRSPWMAGLVVLQAVHTLVVITNPLHGVAWRGYHLDPVLGAATVAYAHQPWLFVNIAGIALMVAGAAFLLVDTFFSYGPLYRTQAAAVALSPVLPGLAFLFWLFEVGGLYPLNLAPLTFPVHLAIDMYAFFGSDLFGLTPAPRRTGVRAAIDDLGSPVLVVDEDGRIVDLNREAGRVFDVDPSGALGTPFDTLLEVAPASVDGETTTVTTGQQRREFAVSVSPLTDATGAAIGSTVVLQDVTAEKRREQRLTVMNRVLRHNLRNDLGLVAGTLDHVASQLPEGDLRSALLTAETRAEAVMDLGDTARRIEGMLDEGGHPTTEVRLAELVEVVGREVGVGGSLQICVPPELRLRTRPAILREVLAELLENAVDHHDGDRPVVEVSATRHQPAAGWVTLAVSDDGPGIPHHEIAAVRRDQETALDHGSGLGLWLVTWGAAALGGEVSFETREAGTTVRLELPAAGSDRGS